MPGTTCTAALPAPFRKYSRRTSLAAWPTSHRHWSYCTRANGVVNKIEEQEQESKHSTNKTAHTLSSRHPRLAIFALTAAGVALGIKYQSDNLARNEKAQRATRDPNYYVSVDRSGGGI